MAMTRVLQVTGAVLGILMSAAAFTSASAQQTAPCGCVQPLPAKGTSIGVLSGANEDVLLTGRKGFGKAAPNAPLALGSRVMVGPNGKGQMKIGASCNLALAPNTTVDVGQASGRVCVRTAAANSDIVLTQNNRDEERRNDVSPPIEDNSGLGLPLAGAAAGVGAGIIIFSGDGGNGNNDPISP